MKRVARGEEQGNKGGLNRLGFPAGLLIALLGGWLIFGQNLPAQDDAAALIEAQLNKATSSFNAGDFKTAATVISDIIARTPNKTKLEPLYYMLGASQFNNGDNEGALATFKDYLTNYPTGPHVNDVNLAMVRSLVNLKRDAEALPILKTMESNPAFREKVLITEADLAKTSGNQAAAIAALEELTKGGLNSLNSIAGAVTLAQLYLDANQPKKAADLFNLLQKNVTRVNSLGDLNKLAIALGDSFLKDNNYDGAIAAYRSVRTKAQIVEIAKRRIDDYNAALESNRQASASHPGLALQLYAENAELKSLVDYNKRLIESYKNIPDFTGAIWIRLGQTYERLGRKWEALVVYNEIISDLPEAKEREVAMLGKIRVLTDLKQIATALATCADFIKNYPQSPNYPLAVYLQGALAFQSKDFATAEANMAKGLPLQTRDDYRNEMEFLLGSAQYSEGKYKDAISSFKKYQTDFAQGKYVQETYYRIALCYMLDGSLPKAELAFQDYIKRFPQGPYAADAAYRSAYCVFASSTPADPRYDDVIAACKKWIDTYPGNPDLGEVEALMADALTSLPPEKGKDHSEEGLSFYLKSVDDANSDQLLHYSLKAATKMLEKKGDWPTISKMWRSVVDKKEEGPMILEGVLAISKAEEHEGKIVEAKKYVMTKILEHAEEPSVEGVEPLISQLAKLCAKRSHFSPLPIAPKAAPPANSDVAAAAPAPAPVRTAAEAKADAKAATAAEEQAFLLDLDSYIKPLENLPSATARARYIFAKAEFFRERRDYPKHDECVKQMVDDFKPEDLSAPLLGLVGDYCLSQKMWDSAQAFYKQLIIEYPKSTVTDAGYIGLGNLSLGKNNYQAALDNFNLALEKISSDNRIRDALLGKAEALMGLAQFDEARSLFETVAANKAWRGESTATSVYNLGEIEWRKNQLPEAQNYFQRVYVAYQRYAPVVAKAYLRSGEVFEKLGQNDEAVRTYREMLKNPRLSAFPETQEARDRLKKLGGTEA